MKQNHFSLSQLLTDLLLLALGALCLAPLVYMVIMSLNDTYSSFAISFNPKDFSLHHYWDILQNDKLLRYLFNSAVYSVGGVLLTVAYSCLAGYAFAKMDFKGANILFFVLLLTMFLPTEVTLVPQYIIIKNLGWLNTYQALILPLPGAFGLFIMRQAMLGVPKELMEAARIDGCGNFRIFYQIMLPLVKYSIIMLVIFTFMATWNSFLWPLVVGTKESIRTFTVGLSTMQTQYDNNVGGMMASATISFLPPFLLYLVLQKRFVEGVAMTGLKG